MAQVVFTVYCKAEPQGSKRGFIVKGQGGSKPRAVVVDTNKVTMRSYRQEVTREAILAVAEMQKGRKLIPGEDWNDGPMAGKQEPVELHLEFMFAKPGSAPKKRVYPAIKPDIDKLVRSTLDALTGVLFADDSQVVKLMADKVYGPQERVHISARVMIDSKLF